MSAAITAPDRAERLRIAVSGATGLVGTVLVPTLRAAGHRVDRISRRPPEAGSTDIQWNPTASRLDPRALEGVDAVVHLAGGTIGTRRWTGTVKERIRRSRVDGTRLLSKTLGALARPPRVLVSVSAVGYYGDRGDVALTEESAPGSGFLADVCREWEA